MPLGNTIRGFYFKVNYDSITIYMIKSHKRWSPAEDSRLVRQVRAFPQNLNKCFIIVGEELGRSPGAVAARWYTTVSKDPKNAAIALITPVSKSFNRKK